MIYFLPIEQFEERYTTQWYNWFKEALDDLNIEYKDINPNTLKKNLETGDVLDIYNTNYYKSMQSCELMQLFNDNQIKDDDIIFMLDAWNPIITQLEYVRQMSKINFKITGILHAGCWDPNDFVNRNNFQDKYMHYSELQWLKSLDKIFVATKFHKDLIESFIRKNLNSNGELYTSKVAKNWIDQVNELRNKIQIVNFPMKLKNIHNSTKENLIVFPHRLDIEKQPNLFDELNVFNSNNNIISEYEFIKTKSVTKNKEDYYSLLSKSKLAISFAKQETFGIAMLESVINGNLPLVPNYLSYAEIYPEIFQYDHAKENDFNYLLNKIRFLTNNYDRFKYLLEPIFSKYYTGAEQILLNLIYG